MFLFIPEHTITAQKSSTGMEIPLIHNMYESYNQRKGIYKEADATPPSYLKSTIEADGDCCASLCGQQKVVPVHYISDWNVDYRHDFLPIQTCATASLSINHYLEKGRGGGCLAFFMHKFLLSGGGIHHCKKL